MGSTRVSPLLTTALYCKGEESIVENSIVLATEKKFTGLFCKSTLRKRRCSAKEPCKRDDILQKTLYSGVCSRESLTTERQRDCTANESREQSPECEPTREQLFSTPFRLWVSFAEEPYKRDDILQMRAESSRETLSTVLSCSRLSTKSFAEYHLFHTALLQKRPETYAFKEPTNRSHPIARPSREDSIVVFSTHKRVSCRISSLL